MHHKYCLFSFESPDFLGYKVHKAKVSNKVAVQKQYTRNTYLSLVVGFQILECFGTENAVRNNQRHQCHMRKDACKHFPRHAQKTGATITFFRRPFEWRRCHWHCATTRWHSFLSICLGFSFFFLLPPCFARLKQIRNSLFTWYQRQRVTECDDRNSFVQIGYDCRNQTPAHKHKKCK